MRLTARHWQLGRWDSDVIHPIVVVELQLQSDDHVSSHAADSEL